MNPTTLARVILMGVLTMGLAMACSGLSCSGAQPVVDAAACSPKADAWHREQLATACAGKLIPQECPEAEAIGVEYRRRENEECSKQP